MVPSRDPSPYGFKLGLIAKEALVSPAATVPISGVVTFDGDGRPDPQRNLRRVRVGSEVVPMGANGAFHAKVTARGIVSADVIVEGHSFDVFWDYVFLDGSVPPPMKLVYATPKD